MILRMFSEEKNLSRERLCEKTGLSDATAKREIAFLKKTGYLERVGSFKSGYWKEYQNNCILGQMFNGWKITLNIWTHYLPSTSPPTRRCTYATSAHHPNLCLVPNHSMASHHRHKTLHRLQPYGYLLRSLFDASPLCFRYAYVKFPLFLRYSSVIPPL